MDRGRDRAVMLPGRARRAYAFEPLMQRLPAGSPLRLSSRPVIARVLRGSAVVLGLLGATSSGCVSAQGPLSVARSSPVASAPSPASKPPAAGSETAAPLPAPPPPDPNAFD